MTGHNKNSKFKILEKKELMEESSSKKNQRPVQSRCAIKDIPM
jgi:hypothetical protein